MSGAECVQQEYFIYKLFHFNKSISGWEAAIRLYFLIFFIGQLSTGGVNILAPTATKVRIDFCFC